MRGFAAIGLVAPKTPANIGSVLRAAGCYGADLVIVAGARGHRAITHCPTDTQKAWRHIPTILCDEIFEAHPVGSIPIAVDLLDDATPLPRFCHPERGFYIFGPEDGTLGKRIHERCKHKIMVPTRHCMNLAACVNVILYDRQSKRADQQGESK